MTRARLVGINHVALEVGDLDAALAEARIESSGGRGLRFQDPWGNSIEIVDYRDIQFTKDSAVLNALGLAELEKTPAARDELRGKGLL